MNINNIMINDSEKYFINEFKSNFKEYKDKPIVLYGIGEKTKLILDNIKDFNFIGLMDRDCVGNIVYGFKVLSYDEVIQSASIIIIVANMSVVELIYKRIAFLRKLYGIKIKYINGTSPRENEENISINPYWSTDIKKLKCEIDRNQVVSFDIFDTLLMRKVLIPSDIFDLVENELNQIYKFNIHYKEKRVEAEKYCYRYIDKHYNIKQIYNVLQSLLGISDVNIMNKIMKIELKFEQKYSIQRMVMFDCYYYAINKGKTVCFTSDIYLTRKYLEHLLSENGINVYDRLFISCEEKKSKYDGSMFELLKQVYKDRRILHIGDNEISDIKIPKKYSINTFEIKSAYDLILISKFKDLLKNVKNISDSILLGQIAAYFLNSPFALSKTKGSLYIDDMYDVGYLSFGPMVLNYILWLIKITRKNNIEKLLFFARDGYILEKVYKKVVKYFNINAPESIYFLTSRRGASVAAIKGRDDISFIIRNMCNIKNIKICELLYTAFGVSAKYKDRFADKYCYEITEKELVEYILYNYEDEILINVSNERKNYLQYIKSLSLKNCSNIGCVNFVGRGITQYFVSKILEKDLQGYYFATEYDIKNIITASDNVHALYGNLVSPHVDKRAIVTKYLFGEVVFTSPNEQFIKFDDNIQLVFEKVQNSKRDFASINRCHDGILAFIEEMIKSDKWILERNFSNDLIDNLFGLFTSEACTLSDNVKNSFIFNDYYNPSEKDMNLFIDK